MNVKSLTETSLRGIEEFYSNLNIGDIADVDYMHKQSLERLRNRTLSKDYDLYLKAETILSADDFENFRKIYFLI